MNNLLSGYAFYQEMQDMGLELSPDTTSIKLILDGNEAALLIEITPMRPTVKAFVHKETGEYLMASEMFDLWPNKEGLVHGGRVSHIEVEAGVNNPTEVKITSILTEGELGFLRDYKLEDWETNV